MKYIIVIGASSKKNDKNLTLLSCGKEGGLKLKVKPYIRRGFEYECFKHNLFST
jgi:hypothetical protein